MGTILLALFFAAHGLIHLGYISPAPPDPNYPFRLNQSWLTHITGMDEAALHTLGTVLAALTVIGFALAGLSTVGLIIPQGWWVSLTVVSAVLSLALMVVFWHPWLVAGVLIDAALLVALLWLGWRPFTPVSL